MTSVEQARQSFHQLEGERKSIRDRWKKACKDADDLFNRSLAIAKGQALAQRVAKEVQDELCFHITSLVTLALRAVFPDPYEFVVRFEEKRGKTEALLLVSRNGEEVDPYDAAGGGVVDVISFALRICMWKLMEKQTRNVLVLDEPFKMLSTDLQSKAGRMLAEVSQKLCLQMIIVTHEEELVEYADKVYICQRRGRVSTIAGNDRQGAAEEGKKAEG